jgi:hypothetical protein
MNFARLLKANKWGTVKTGWAIRTAPLINLKATQGFEVNT